MNGAQNSHGDTESVSNYSHHSHSDIKAFGELKQNKPSTQPEPKTQIEQSWIYTFCIKCRGEDNTPSYEPKLWQRFCPFPLCPSFRQFARLWSIIIIGAISWLIFYAILGSTAAPGGHFFGMVLLIVASNFGGFLMSLTTLPRLIGMLITGILFQVPIFYPPY